MYKKSDLMDILTDKMPQMFITKNKQRIKQYGSVVYLKNGEEFQLEIYNPRQNKILAKFELNGKAIGSGIVLRPGERVFLERHLESNNKFLFETYTIDGNNKSAVKAIENNGSVKVEFFDELVWQTSSTITWTNSGDNWWNGCIYSGGIDPYLGRITATYSTSIPGANLTYTSSCATTNNNLETGRVEKGSESGQYFVEDNTNFSYFPINSIEWKIIPESRKQITKEDIVVYCGGCGRKKREKERYCPSCGYKF